MEAHNLIPIFSIVFVAFSTWVLISITKNRIAMLFIIPFMVTMAGTTYVVIDSVLGYPTDRPVAKESEYLTHMVSLDKRYIYIWAIDGEKPRAYQIWYTEEDEEKLEQAKDKRQQGVPQMIEGTTQRKGEDKENSPGAIHLYDFDLSGKVKK